MTHFLSYSKTNIKVNINERLCKRSCKKADKMKQIIIFVFVSMCWTSVAGQQYCFTQGTCVDSTIIGGRPAQDYNECLEACKSNEVECLYFSFVPSGDCIFFKNCNGGPQTSQCPNCFTGKIKQILGHLNIHTVFIN